MWPFNTTNEMEDEVDMNELVEETVEIEETREKEYTEHKAIAVWEDGSEEEFVFDEMNKDEISITLKDYTDYYHSEYSFYPSQFVGEAFVTIPLENLKKFETVNRETKSIEYTATKEVPKSEVED